MRLRIPDCPVRFSCSGTRISDRATARQRAGSSSAAVQLLRTSRTLASTVRDDRPVHVGQTPFANQIARVGVLAEIFHLREWNDQRRPQIVDWFRPVVAHQQHAECVAYFVLPLSRSARRARDSLAYNPPFTR